MQIYLNGNWTQVPDRITMQLLIESLDLGGRRIAVEVNEAILPRSAFKETQLQEGDKVEIIHAVGGG